MAVSLLSLLQLPAFVGGTLALYLIFSLGSLLGFVRWWDLRSTQRNDVHGAVRFMVWLFRVKILKGGTQELCQAPCMYLCNHRSWADFVVDMFITGARGVPLSRLAVGAGFPAFTTSLLALRSILLFHREGIRDKERFNAWLDRELARGPQHSLLTYPEGTRNRGVASLPLKHGMLRYAFTRRMPVQAVITAGKEEVLNEAMGWAHFGRTVVTGFSEVLDSSRFDHFEDFMAAAQALWDGLWAEVHSAPRHGLPELPDPVAAPGNYTPAMLAGQTAALAFWTAIMLWAAWNTLRALRALAEWSLAGRLLVAGLGLWAGASLLAAALLPPPAEAGRRRKGAAGTDISPAGSSDEASAKAS